MMLKRLALSGLLVFVLVACNPILDPDASLRTFDNVLRHESSDYLLVEEESGFDVTVQWTILDEWNADWVSSLHVYNLEGELITQEDVRPEEPASGNTLNLLYPVRPPETGFDEGTYSVLVGWYINQEPYERLLMAQGTSYATDKYLVFTFSIDSDGAISLPTLELEADS